MKFLNKIFLSLGVLSILFSCSGLNLIPKFNDKDAFAAFKTNSIAVKEDIGIVKIPIGIASINPKEVSVTYNVIDSTAKAGLNYSLVDPSAVLHFDGTKREAYIEIKINNLHSFTGDLIFAVEIASAGDLNIGTARKCIVTIKDLDHPLSEILGEWEAHAINGANETLSWNAIIDKNGDDLKSVRVYNISPVYSGYVKENNYFVANVVFDSNNAIEGLLFPVGQEASVKFGDFDILLSIYEEATDRIIYGGGNIEVMYKDGELTFLQGLSPYMPQYNDGAGAGFDFIKSGSKWKLKK